MYRKLEQRYMVTTVQVIYGYLISDRKYYFQLFNAEMASSGHLRLFLRRVCSHDLPYMRSLSPHFSALDLTALLSYSHEFPYYGNFSVFLLHHPLEHR
jgi:hypothetical protein